MRRRVGFDDGQRQHMGQQVDAGRGVLHRVAQHHLAHPGQARVVDRLEDAEQRVAADQVAAARKRNPAPVEALAVQGRHRLRQRLAVRDQVVAGFQPTRRHCAADVGAQCLREPHCAFDVELAGALLEQVCIRQRLCGVLQDRLHQRRRQARVDLQQQCRCAGHGGCRHRGAAELHQLLIQGLRGAGVAGALHQRRVDGGEQVAVGRRLVLPVRDRAEQAVAGCHQVGFDDVVVPAAAGRQSQAAAGRAARAEAGHQIIDARRRGLRVGRADGNHRRLVAR